jgi:hypothetical protein
MFESGGRDKIGAYALQILPPVNIRGAEIDTEGTVWKQEGPKQVPIKAIPGGFIIFEFNKSKHYSGGAVPSYKLGSDRKIPQNVIDADAKRKELAYSRFVYMNAFLGALASSISTVEKRGYFVQAPVDPNNYFVPKQIANGWKMVSDAGRKFELPKHYGKLSVEALDNTTDILNRFYLKLEESSFSILALMYQACYQYQQHQFSSAHLIAWTVIEALLNKEWKEFQNKVDKKNNGHTVLNNKRKELLNGRDYTASIISQILSLAGEIDDEMLNRLDVARQRRNDFAHKLEAIESSDAGKTIRLATDLIQKITGVTVTSQLSLSYWI